MWVSPKKFILTSAGEVKEAGPGVSGTVLVGAGAEIPEEEARRYGILNDGKEASAQPSELKPSVIRDNQPLPKEINFGKVEAAEPKVKKPWTGKVAETEKLDTALPSE